MGSLRDFVTRNDMMQLPAANFLDAQYHAVGEKNTTTGKGKGRGKELL